LFKSAFLALKNSVKENGKRRKIRFRPVIDSLSRVFNSKEADPLRIRGTVERYLKALEETFIITPVYPYFKNPRQEIIKQNKIYFNDVGLRNYALGIFSLFEERTDAGFLLENAVFKEILLSLKTFEKVRFWRTKQGGEIDFLVIKGETLIPMEVKSKLKSPKIPLGLRNFLEKYSAKMALVVNMDIYEKSVNKVYFIHPYEIRRYLR